MASHGSAEIKICPNCKLAFNVKRQYEQHRIECKPQGIRDDGGIGRRDGLKPRW